MRSPRSYARRGGSGATTALVTRHPSPVTRHPSPVTRHPSPVLAGLVGLVGLVTIEATAWADWPYSTLVAEQSGTVLPSAVAVRNRGPTDRVYIVVEKQDIDASPATSLELSRYLCTGGASCTPTLYGVGTWPMAVGGTLGIQANLHPSMAIDADGQGVEDVDIIRRDKIDTDCDDDGNTSEAAENALDLQNYDYHTDTNAVATRLRVESNVGNTVNDACVDSGVSMLKHGPGALNACYTFKENPQVLSDDRLKCNDNGGNPSGEWANDLLLTSAVVEDHPAFDFKDGDRVVVGGRRPAGDDQIRFHFPDVSTPEPTFDLSVNGDMSADPILPDMIAVAVASGDILLGVWEAEDNHKEIRLGRCPAADDCLQSADWIVTTPVTTADGKLEHPEIANDGPFQILVWEEDDDENAGQERIYAATRCGVQGTWGTPELLRTPDDPEDSQSILFGNPHVALNRDDNVAHVVFMELNVPNDDSEVWWVRKSYTDCP